MHARNSRDMGSQRPSRHQRRAQQREAERGKARTHAGRGRQRANPLPLLVGSVVMLAAMLAALIVGGIAILRSSSDSIGAGGPAAVAMVDRTALNPAVTLLKVGKPAPDFAVRSESGGRVSLSSQRGHPVLLEFFAVWCPVCHRETPVMHSLTAAYHAKGLRTLAVLANPYGPEYEISRGKDLTIATASDLRWYARTYRANYPLLVDRTFASVNRYGAGSYPTIYLIDASGKVAYAAHGAVPRTALAARIQKLVSRTS